MLREFDHRSFIRQQIIYRLNLLQPYKCVVFFIYKSRMIVIQRTMQHPKKKKKKPKTMLYVSFFCSTKLKCQLGEELKSKNDK